MTATSPWECGECGQPEDEKSGTLSLVCHHCGKLLCRDCRIRVIDGAFAGSAIDLERLAMHCRDCRVAFHPRAPAL